MKFSKVFVAITMAFLLTIPTNVLAAEHQHDFVMYSTSSKTSSAEYCSITTFINKQLCKTCGYKLESSNTEYVPHTWEIVCVDPANSGYQRKCKTCGRATGAIYYPSSVIIPDVEY